MTGSAASVLDRVSSGEMLIGDKWVDKGEGAPIPVRNPATADIIAEVPAGGARDACAAGR